jgi:hypothetical protein
MSMVVYMNLLWDDPLVPALECNLHFEAIIVSAMQADQNV